MQLPVLFVGILVGATLLDAASVPGGSGEDRIRWMLRDTAETTTVDTSTNNDADVGDGSEFQYDATTTSDSDDDNAGEVRMLTLDYNPAELYAYIDQVLISPCYTHSQAPLNILLNLYTCLDRVTGFNKKIDLFQATPDNVSFANLPLVRRLDVSQTSSGLQVLLRQFKDNAPQICMNPEPVMQCLDAYLQACFPPPAASNDTSSDDAWMRDVAAFVDMFNTNRSDTDASTAEPATSEATTLEPATTEATTEEASSTHEPGTMEPTTTAESEDSTNNDSLPVLVVAEVDVTITRLDDGPASGFFGVPFLNQADQISRLIRQGMQVLCESNQDLTAAAQLPAEDFLDQVPCMIRTAGIEQPCSTDKLQDSGSDMDNGQNPNAYCRMIEQYAECFTQEVSRRCSRVSGEALQIIGDQYLQAITPQCQPPAGSNTSQSMPTQWSEFPEFTAADNITALNGTNTTSPWDWIFLLF